VARNVVGSGDSMQCGKDSDVILRRERAQVRGRQDLPRPTGASTHAHALNASERAHPPTYRRRAHPVENSYSYRILYPTTRRIPATLDITTCDQDNAMDEPSRKRRKTSSPAPSSPRGQPARRRSFASPTKASLARNYPSLLPPQSPARD
jgi:hypothetical protein